MKTYTGWEQGPYCATISKQYLRSSKRSTAASKSEPRRGLRVSAACWGVTPSRDNRTTVSSPRFTLKFTTRLLWVRQEGLWRTLQCNGRLHTVETLPVNQLYIDVFPLARTIKLIDLGARLPRVYGIKLRISVTLPTLMPAGLELCHTTALLLSLLRLMYCSVTMVGSVHCMRCSWYTPRW